MSRAEKLKAFGPGKKLLDRWNGTNPVAYFAPNGVKLLSQSELDTKQYWHEVEQALVKLQDPRLGEGDDVLKLRAELNAVQGWYMHYYANSQDGASARTAHAKAAEYTAQALKLRERDVADAEGAHCAVVHELLHGVPHHVQLHARVRGHAGGDSKRVH